jgi:hypothetical protein
MCPPTNQCTMALTARPMTLTIRPATSTGTLTTKGQAPICQGPAEPRGDLRLQVFSWGKPAKTLCSSHGIIASNLSQIKKSFTVKLLTIANYPLLL